MTSRPSRPRRSSGSRAALALGALALAGGLLGAPALDAAAGAPPLTETRDGVEIDWAEGTLTAPAGSAADLRMPSADVARAGAVRRAEAAARVLLGRALAELPLGGGRKLATAEVARAVGRARASRTEYQTNGGALVWLTVRFGDWSEAAPEGPASPAAVVAVPAMHLGAAPLAKLGPVRVTARRRRWGRPCTGPARRPTTSRRCPPRSIGRGAWSSTVGARPSSRGSSRAAPR
jgi:hypothetical protein